MHKQPSLFPEMLSCELVKRVQRLTDKLDEAYSGSGISGFRTTQKMRRSNQRISIIA